MLEDSGMWERGRAKMLSQAAAGSQRLRVPGADAETGYGVQDIS